MEPRQELNFELVIIGGGISASFLCLDILRKDPSFKILIIENSIEFPQKIGESVVDMTALILEEKGIGHLLSSQTKKSGIRFLFNERLSKDRSDIAEFASPTFPGRIKAYHLDRKRLDQDLLEEVEKRGVTVFRPAEIVFFERRNELNKMHVSFLENEFYITSPWTVDASGRARVLSKLLNWKDLSIDLKTGSIMAHFKHIQPNEKWDTPENKYWDNNAIALRKYSTTHLMRPNSWWWIIRLDDITTSIGVMFDKQKIQFDSAEAYFMQLIEEDPELSRMTNGAEMISIRHIEQVPYVSEKLVEQGVALIGDSGAFLDPLFSPGLELIGQQSLWLSDLLVQEKVKGRFNQRGWEKYASTFHKAYETRLLMYRYAYGIMGSYDLFTAWTKLGNFVYLSRIVYPSVVFKAKLKMPLRFSFMERFGVNVIGPRLNRIYEKRKKQGRISVTKTNHLEYSGVRVPKDKRFVIIPFILLFKAVRGYLSLELSELFSSLQSIQKRTKG